VSVLAREWFYFSRIVVKQQLSDKVGVNHSDAIYFKKQAIEFKAKDRKLSYKMGVRHNDYLLAKS
jgi:hypothetical protein